MSDTDPARPATASAYTPRMRPAIEPMVAPYVEKASAALNPVNGESLGGPGFPSGADEASRQERPPLQIPEPNVEMRPYEYSRDPLPGEPEYEQARRHV